VAPGAADVPLADEEGDPSVRFRTSYTDGTVVTKLSISEWGVNIFHIL